MVHILFHLPDNDPVVSSVIVVTGTVSLLCRCFTGLGVISCPCGGNL